MMTAKEVKQLISANQDDIAFVIGNGINRYENKGALAWDKLLIDICTVITGSSSAITNKEGEIIKGISYTEIYDILTLQLDSLIKKISDVLGCNVNNNPNDEKYNELNSQLYSMREYLIDCKTLHQKYPNEFSVPKYLENENNKSNIDSSQSTLSEFAKLSALMAQVVKWNNKKTLTDRVREYCIIQARFNTNKQGILPQAISSVIESWDANINQEVIIKKIEALNAPILTTNYDNVLSKCVGAKLKKIPKQKFTDFYPWSSYFSNKDLDNPLKGFGVWHINGVVDYRRSIKLGLSQYMGCVAHARKMIQSSEGGKEIFEGKNQSNWIGKDTWLHIIFNKSLFIFGLALEENEVFLRWLLLQRANYFNQFEDRKLDGWYLTTKEEIDNSPGKKFFLESVGIKILEVEDYKTIYEDIWQ